MKKAVALSMALAMAASMLAACGGSSSTASSTSTASSDATSTAASSTDASGTGERPTVTFMIPAFYGTEFANDGSDVVVQTYEDYTNTHVEWRLEASDTYGDKFGMTLMDRDNMPMILCASGALNANIVDAAKKGAFWDLSGVFSDSANYPNLSKANPGTLNALTVDGQVIGVPRVRAVGRQGLSYRTDWAEAVGITEAPKTVEDVYNMWYKFAHEDPDGNGKDDTYGLELCKYTGPLDIIQTWFGCGNGWVEKDGQLVSVFQTEEYKEALKWMRKCYEDGLIRPDWATVDTSTWEDACKKGEAGSFVDTMDGGRRIWTYYINNNIPSVVDPSTTASMTLVGPIAKDASSEPKTLATSGYNGFYLITKSGAKTEEDFQNCMNFLEKMNDDAMLDLADYGLEGVSYTVENGYVVMNPDLTAAQLPNAGLNQAVSYTRTDTPDRLQKEMTEPQQACEDAYKINEAAAVFNPALGLLANSTVNAEVGTDIAQIMDDARTQYICGQIDDAGLDKAINEWLARGGQDLINELNELYKASK